MSKHRFAVLSEQGESSVKSAEFEALFASDVTFNGPFLMKPITDKALTLRFINDVFAFVGYPAYVQEFTDEQRTTLFLWEGPVTGPDGRTFMLEGSIAITEGEDGLIHKVVAYLRPLQVGILLKNTMVESIASVLPKEYYEAVKPAS